MSRFRRIIIGVAGAFSFLLILTALTVAFIPAKKVEELVAKRLASQGYSFRAAKVTMAFPLGIVGRGVEISNAQGPLLLVDRLTVKPRLLSLLAGRVVIRANVVVAGGTADVEMDVRSGAWEAAVRGVRLQEVPWIATTAGVAAKGELFGNGFYSGGRRGNGELKVEIRALDLKSVRIGGVPLPDAGYDRVQGLVAIKGGAAEVASLNLQGSSLYVRLRGRSQLLSPINQSPLDLTLELMPKPEFLEEQKLVFLLLVKYLDSPGHYQIPVRGTLGRPAIP